MTIYEVLGVLGGLGLFLIGMKLMGEGLELAAGSKLRTLLEKITSNKFVAMLVGLLVTAVIQSSSATDAMVVGFVNAGLMQLEQSVGILFGSKIGTTVTSLLLAIDIKKIVPLFTFVGVAVMIFVKKNNYKFYGQIAAGFGILFQGMSIMSENFNGLKESDIFMNVVSSMQFPLLGIVVGLVFTAIIQSSSASIGILMALGAAGVVTLPDCIYIIYGMNIGACMAAVLSAAGANRESKRVALCNFLISFIGAIIMTTITMLLDLTNFSITNIFEHIFPGNAAAQISATHIMFNIAITIILLPCAGLLIRLTRFIMPDKEEQEEEITVYLDSRILTTPPVAVQQTEKECARLAELARKSFDLSYEAVFHKDSKAIERLEENELVVDKLTHGITKYIVKINGLDIMDYDRKVMGAMYNAIQDLERIGDRSENICEAAQELINSDVEFSDEAKKELKELFKTVQGILDDSFYMFTHQSKDPDLMESVLKAEDQIDDYTEMFRLNHIKRLSMNKCSAEAGTIFLEMLTNLERIGDHAVTVAFCIPYKRPQQIPANLETN
jgi:phosphate:Na+ symporter